MCMRCAGRSSGGAGAVIGLVKEAFLAVKCANSFLFETMIQKAAAEVIELVLQSWRAHVQAELAS